jgi:hypothetical protein
MRDAPLEISLLPRALGKKSKRKKKEDAKTTCEKKTLFLSFSRRRRRRRFDARVFLVRVSFTNSSTDF